mmetsp:Transcript_27568/g.40534  ORF Transcript_27568/g.40534 Transcript_27568/m.40534 type:complete len:230 (-) Transcript_27568:607-1296(-)
MESPPKRRDTTEHGRFALMPSILFTRSTCTLSSLTTFCLYLRLFSTPVLVLLIISRGVVGVVCRHIRINCVHIRVLILDRRLGCGRSCNRGNGWRRIGCRLVRHVLLHLIVETNLVVGCLVFVRLLLFRSKGAPALTHNRSKLHKLDPRVLFHDLRTHVEGKEHERASGALRRGRIFHFLHFACRNSMVLYEIPLSIVSRRRTVGCHFGVETSLVLGRAGLPSCFFFRS